MEISISNTDINGVKIVNYDSFLDKRGTIWSTFIKSKFKSLNLIDFTHDKFSMSYKNVISKLNIRK